MQIDTGFADVNGTRLYYEISGSGHPLVFIHGFTLDTRMWDDQFEVFAEQYRVFRYDARGFGKSTPPTTEPYTHTGDLRALMTHLGIESAHLVGLSMGGRIALDFAVTYPELAVTLNLLDAGLPGFPAQEPIRAVLRAKGEQEGVESAKEWWLNHALFAPALENPVSATSFRQILEDYSGWHFMNDDPATAPEAPAIDKLDTLTMPTLVVVGERDLPDYHQIADIIVEQIAGAKKVVILGAGHMPNMEFPEQINKIVLGFLSEVA